MTPEGFDSLLKQNQAKVAAPSGNPLSEGGRDPANDQKAAFNGNAPAARVETQFLGGC